MDGWMSGWLACVYVKIIIKLLWQDLIYVLFGGRHHPRGRFVSGMHRGCTSLMALCPVS